MNIDGLGPETVDMFYRLGLIKNTADLYKLTVSPTKRIPKAKITRSKGTVLLCAIPVIRFSADFSPIRSKPLISSAVSLYKSAVFLINPKR